MAFLKTSQLSASWPQKIHAPVEQRTNLFDFFNIILILAIVLLSSLPTPAYTHAFPTIFPAVLSIISYGYILRRRKGATLDGLTQKWLFTIFLLRLAIILYLNQYWWQPQAVSIPGNDWDRYEVWGWLLAQQGASYHAATTLPLSDLGSVYYVALVYMVLGHNPAALAVTGALITGLTALGVYRLASRLTSTVAARRAAIWFSLLPLGLLFTAVPSKDMLVCSLYLFVVILLLELRVGSKPLVWTLFWICLGVAGLLFTRSLMLYIVVLGFGLDIIIKPKQKKRSFITSLAMLGVLGAALLTVMLRAKFFEREQTEGIITVSEAGLSSYSRPYQFTTTLENSLSYRLFWNGDWRKAYLIPARSLMVFYIPFPPLKFDDLYETMESLNVWALLILLPAVIASTWDGSGHWLARARELLPCWAPLVTVAVALGAGLPFVEARYALVVFPFYCILAARGFTTASPRTLRLYYAMLPVGIGLLFGTYMMLK